MSKKRRKPKPHTIQLEVGKIYNVHDGSPSGHPGQIAEANPEEDIYLCITLGSLSEEEVKNNVFRKDYIVLSHTTSKDVFRSLIHRRPFLGSRDDYGDVEYLEIKINEEDYKIVKSILKKKPRIGFWLKKKNKKMPSR